MPQLARLPSIGSAAANWGQRAPGTSESEAERREESRRWEAFIYMGPEADLILHQYGQAEYDQTVDRILRERRAADIEATSSHAHADAAAAPASTWADRSTRIWRRIVAHFKRGAAWTK
ncbi:MAG: hypothetical protein M1838_001953 [Thelocarpon superellum]|nr:MAG: hypothetical protein M1838_001953 [Thelocarpon superellum]